MGDGAPNGPRSIDALGEFLENASLPPLAKDAIAQTALDRAERFPHASGVRGGQIVEHFLEGTRPNLHQSLVLLLHFQDERGILVVELLQFLLSAGICRTHALDLLLEQATLTFFLTGLNALGHVSTRT